MKEMTQANATAHTAFGCWNGLGAGWCELMQGPLPEGACDQSFEGGQRGRERRAVGVVEALQFALHDLGAGGVALREYGPAGLGDADERGPTVGRVGHPLGLSGASSRLITIVIPGWVSDSRLAQVGDPQRSVRLSVYRVVIVLELIAVGTCRRSQIDSRSITSATAAMSGMRPITELYNSPI